MAFVAGCSSSSTPPASTDGGAGGTTPATGPNRTVVTCADVKTEESTQSGGTFAAGVWGNVPAGLQSLPPNATLCGATSLAGQVLTHIASPIWGDDIFAFYNPLVKALGCTLQPMDTAADSQFTMHSRTSFTCTNGAQGTISATSETQYIVTFTAGH